MKLERNKITTENASLKRKYQKHKDQYTTLKSSYESEKDEFTKLQKEVKLLKSNLKSQSSLLSLL